MAADRLSIASSPDEDFDPLSNITDIVSPRTVVSESSEKSDTSLSDVDENGAMPREYDLSEQYGRTPPSRNYVKPSREKNKSFKKRREKSSETRSCSTSPISQKRRQSASATSGERALNRSIKEEGFLIGNRNNHDDMPIFRQRHRSFTESSVSRKSSHRKFLSIRYKESSCSAGPSGCLKETNNTVCPMKRIQFYETLNLLVNLGQGTNSETKEKPEEDAENYEVEELKEALWLELQAWYNTTTMLEQDEYLMTARTKINSILDDVINFQVDNSKNNIAFGDDVIVSSDSESEFDSDEESYCLLHTTFSSDESLNEDQSDIQFNDSTLEDSRIQSTSSEKSESSTIFDDNDDDDDDPPKLSEFAKSVKTAASQVTSLLNKLYDAEQLYPSRGALSKEIEKYNSEELKKSLDTMLLWLNIIKGLYHKLHVMSQVVHVDFNDETVWKDWIELGLGSQCVKTTNSCRRCKEFASNCDYNMPDQFEGFKRGLSSEITSTSRYRFFVDQGIKKMGVGRLGYKIHQIMHMELGKASATLQVNPLENVFLKHKNLHILFHNLLLKSMKDPLFFDPNDEKSYDYMHFGVPQENWVQRFEEMGLPSFDKLYIFLVRLVMDIYHECLRMRMEHRPKGEPSPLSVRQLLEECKEVLTAAVVVRQFYLDSLEMIGKDLSSYPQMEEGILEFDQDIQNMLEVYFEYLHSLMHLLQRLPEASCGVKNILEEEWVFVKQLTPYIRGGEVQAGKRFCVMACGLLESTADFLEEGMDEYFSGLHDSNGDEKLRVKVLQSCRDFKKLFKETRERGIKALGFVKRLKVDLGVAVKFHINVPLQVLLEKLKATRYIQVVTKQNISVMIFIRQCLRNSKNCLNALLNACCGLYCQPGSCSKGVDNFIILVRDKHGVNCQWTGDKVDFAPALDTSLGLVDIQVDELALVACSSTELQGHSITFKSQVGEAVSCSSGPTSCHHDLIDMESQIKAFIINLRRKICEALDGAVENFDVEKMYDVDENERTRLCRSTLEALQFAFNAVFDFHREMKKIPGPDEVAIAVAGTYFLGLAYKWMDFVLKRCERGKGVRPRWATQGLKFLIEACHPTISCRLSDIEFEKLQCEINNCVDHVIGSADNWMNSASPDSRETPWGPTAKFLRSSTFPGTFHAHSHPTRTFSEPGRPVIKRTMTLGNESSVASEEDQIEIPRLRILQVRSRVAKLEYTRQCDLLDKHVIGRVSNKKRDLAGELAVIPKRVPFKWQRGNKIGEGQFGKVYSCVNLDTAEVVAMKQITFHPNDHSSFQDLADEIKAFEGLAHDSLVKYYGCEVHRDVMYIFMEYCGDGTISDVSKLGLPEAMIRKYTDQILVAVGFLHDRGIVHRDIKGPNIFLSSEGLIKLGDFGASVKLVDPSQTMCGEVSTLRGTITYMAPEVYTLDKGAGYGRAADMWSVGCVVVEMASGKPPWTEYDNQWAIMLKVGDGGSPAVPECLSEEGKDFLSNCFVHNPHERWTARQLQNHTFLKFG